MQVEKQDANLELTQSSLFLSDEASLCFIFYSTPADDFAAAGPKFWQGLQELFQPLTLWTSTLGLPFMALACLDVQIVLKRNRYKSAQLLPGVSMTNTIAAMSDDDEDKLQNVLEKPCRSASILSWKLFVNLRSTRQYEKSKIVES